MIDLSVIAWRMPEWITAYGGLRTENVLEYFAQSPFYDRHSNNQLLKMQTQFNTLGDLQGHLKKMRGIEFVVVLEQEPDVWVIYKQHRLSEQEVSVLTVYFVANESIYMAPSIHAVIASRMLNIILSLREALSSAHSLHDFSSIFGHSYISVPIQAHTVLNEESFTQDVLENHRMRRALNSAFKDMYYVGIQNKHFPKLEQETISKDNPKLNDTSNVLTKKRKKNKKSQSPSLPSF